MLYPSINDLLKGDISRYSLVIATAKLARKISDDAKQGEQSSENPIKTAVNIVHKGIRSGQLKIVEQK